MSKNPLPFLLVAYAIPYPFLAMWEDAAFGTLWFYGVMILALFLLGRFSIRRKLCKVMFAGNFISLLVSLLCVHLFQTEKWLWYFKPFSSVQMLLLLTTVIILTECFACFTKRGAYEKNDSSK